MVINEQIDLIVGIRKICALRFSVCDPENEVFVPIRAIESETDHYPVGERRTQYADEYLSQMDAEMASYLKEVKEEILSSCKNIINVYGST